MSSASQAINTIEVWQRSNQVLDICVNTNSFITAPTALLYINVHSLLLCKLHNTYTYLITRILESHIKKKVKFWKLWLKLGKYNPSCYFIYCLLTVLLKWTYFQTESERHFPAWYRSTCTRSPQRSRISISVCECKTSSWRARQKESNPWS